MNFKILGGVLILAGTAIGAGMLALPITTGPAGILNASGLFVVACGFMMYTLFLLLESTLRAKSRHKNLISLTGEVLGPTGQLVAWCCCLLLLYAVSAAYLTGGGAIIYSVTKASSWLSLPNEQAGMLVFWSFIGIIGCLRARIVDLFNRGLMLALITSFAVLLFGTTHDAPAFTYSHGLSQYLLPAVSVIFLSFTCHPVFPTICAYFDYNVKTLKKVIVIGCVVPLVFYSIWEAIILGLLPLEGHDGLLALSQAEFPVNAMIHSLEVALSRHWLGVVVTWFSFFAMATSYLAVTISLVDFIEDGLVLKSHSRSVAMLATLLPPLLFAIAYPEGFITALGYAGVFVAVLYCILPALMVAKQRWLGGDNAAAEGGFRAPGGWFTLAGVCLVSLLIVVVEVGLTLDWL